MGAMSRPNCGIAGGCGCPALTVPAKQNTDASVKPRKSLHRPKRMNMNIGTPLNFIEVNGVSVRLWRYFPVSFTIK